MDTLARFPKPSQPPIDPANLAPLQPVVRSAHEGEDVLNRLISTPSAPVVPPMEQVAQPAAQPQEPKNVDDAMYTDIDLRDFFLTGEVTYTTKIRNMLNITFRLLSASEVADLNNELYKDNDLAANTALINHAIRTITRAVVTYGDTDMRQKDLGTRANFYRALPALLVNEVAKRYSIFEQSVGKMLSDQDYVKN